MRLSRLVWSPYETPTDQEAERAMLAQRVDVIADDADAEILVTTSNRRIDGALLDAHPSARLVITTTSGHDHIDLPALADRGVQAARLPQARRDAVVETSLGLCLTALRGVPPMQAAAAEGRWIRRELPTLGMRNLRDCRVGVLGLGVIGREMARVLTLLGAEVWGHDPRGVPDGVQAAPPEALVAECDVLTIHCSLTDSSRGLVDADLLARAEGLVLLNTARGETVDVPAAVEALDAGRLSFLGLDVFPTEPWPHLRQVRGRPGLVLLPHAAGYHDGLPAMVRDGLAATIDAFLAGRPLPHPLTPRSRRSANVTGR